jgi:hypothetical protein
MNWRHKQYEPDEWE